MKSSLLIKITAILMVAVTMFTLASCSLFEGLIDDGSTTEPSAVVTLSPRPSDTVETVEYLNKVLNNIKASMPGVSVTRENKIRSVETGDNDEVEALINITSAFAKSKQLKEIEDKRDFGSDLNDFLPLVGTSVVSRLTADDVAEATIKTRGATEENPEPTDNNRFYYDINVVINDSDKLGPVAKAFDLNINKEDVLAQFQDYTDTIEVSDYDVNYTECSIYAVVNKETDQVIELSYTLNAVVTTTVNFLGSLEHLGETEISFNYQQNADYEDFVWELPEIIE